MGVHAVDLDGEINEYALLAAAIHAMLLGIQKGGQGMVGAPGGETKVTSVTRRPMPKV
jgi:hypothetical protein